MFEASRVLQEEEQTSSDMDKLRATVERYRVALKEIGGSDKISIEITPWETRLNRFIDIARTALGSE